MGPYFIIEQVNSLGIMTGYHTLLYMKYLLFDDVMPNIEIYELYVK